MAINGIKSFLTKKLPSGVQEVGGKTTDLVKGQLQGATKGLMDEAKDAYSDLKSAVTGKASLGSVLPDDSRIPERKIGLKKSGVETNAMPADYNPDLCFRMDFVEYSRSQGFADDGLPKKAEGQLRVSPTGTFILPIPLTIGNRIGVNYNGVELEGAGQVENLLRTADNNAKSALGTGMTGLAESPELALTAGFRSLLNTTGGKALGLAAGFTPNPNLANLFTGVQLREFQFDFKIVPRSQEESKRALQMFQQLRKYMLPSLTTNKFNLTYPDEVVISFSEAGSRLINKGPASNSTPLDQIFNFKRCVLTNISVDVNSDGDQAFFTDYSPVEMKLTLSFKEQSIQTRTDYDNSPDDVFLPDGFTKSAGAVGDNVTDAVQNGAAGLSRFIARNGGGF